MANTMQRLRAWVNLPGYHLKNCPYCFCTMIFWKPVGMLQADYLLVKPTMDHIVPRARGGNNRKTNIIVCCAECNSLKSDFDLETFLAWLKYWRGY